ncbi:hypothetical protein L195_g013868, partial [Trifolium pratense]
MLLRDVMVLGWPFHVVKREENALHSSLHEFMETTGIPPYSIVFKRVVPAASMVARPKHGVVLTRPHLGVGLTYVDFQPCYVVEGFGKEFDGRGLRSKMHGYKRKRCCVVCSNSFEKRFQRCEGRKVQHRDGKKT